MEIDLDLWPLVAHLVPLLEELERVEALAAWEEPPEDDEQPERLPIAIVQTKITIA